MKRLLVVDDVPLFRAGLASALRDAGFEVVAEAGGGEAAVTAAEEHHPDLVLLDILMQCLLGSKGSGIDKFAYDPDNQSGKFQRHCDRRLGGSTNNSSYKIKIPVYRKSGLTRIVDDTPVELATEQLLEELEDELVFYDALAEAVRERKLPPSYYDHEAQPLVPYICVSLCSASTDPIHI